MYDLLSLQGYYHGVYFTHRVVNGVDTYIIRHDHAEVRLYTIDAVKRYIDVSM